MRRVMIMLCAIASLWASVEGAARAGDGLAAQSLVALEFVDDRGRVLTSYPASSGRSSVYRAYLEAQREARYSIRARNLTGHRVGIVIAVDGRNIISGERSELRSSESMYVLEPDQTAIYAGWRTSETEVHRFYFTNVTDSYAGRIGDESAVGVIAAAVYEARPAPVRYRGRRSRDVESASAPSAQPGDSAEGRAQRSERAGTGFGESRHSRAVRVSFSPARRASERSFFKYEWSEQLCARGVKSCGPANRFWPESGHGFVPFPPVARAHSPEL